MSDDGPPPRHPLDGRCGTCARFIRVVETIDDTGEVHRSGDCLLQVWPSPLKETNGCSQYVRKGTFAAKPQRPEREPRRRSTYSTSRSEPEESPLVLKEELLEMDAEEFRDVLRSVLREELGISRTQMAPRWQGGEIVLKPGKEGTADKHIPLEAFFRKIVSLRDKLRVLEQKVNSHPKLTDEDRIGMQQYITQIYGSLTTFNILFSDKDDNFVGQKGDE